MDTIKVRAAAESLFLAAERHREALQLIAAIELYQLAEKEGSGSDRCSAARWTCYMLIGEWELAWRESDAIARRGAYDPHRYWDGSSWAGKNVLIRCLHGLGDTLQFVRYVPLMRRQAASVTLETQPKLKRLLQLSDLADQVITWGDQEPAWQLQMEINELPRAFRTLPSTIPQAAPYLVLPGLNQPGRPANPALQVGLIWAASDFDPTRNVPLPLLEPLLDLPGIDFYSLQAGDACAERPPSRLRILSGRETCIADIAREMMSLDLVLTVDTMNAHLAGALGRRTWTLLPFQCDWRWMLERTDTPWYPAMRLFRQPAPGDWMSVIDQLKTALLMLRASRDSVDPANNRFD